jgi:hypothetical protein
MYIYILTSGPTWEHVYVIQPIRSLASTTYQLNHLLRALLYIG